MRQTWQYVNVQCAMWCFLKHCWQEVGDTVFRPIEANTLPVLSLKWPEGRVQLCGPRCAHPEPTLSFLRVISCIQSPIFSEQKNPRFSREKPVFCGSANGSTAQNSEVKKRKKPPGKSSWVVLSTCSLNGLPLECQDSLCWASPVVANITCQSKGFFGYFSSLLQNCSLPSGSSNAATIAAQCKSAAEDLPCRFLSGMNEAVTVVSADTQRRNWKLRSLPVEEGPLLVQDHFNRSYFSDLSSHVQKNLG